jgi:polysaccharide biosynthesis transport protein
MSEPTSSSSSNARLALTRQYAQGDSLSELLASDSHEAEQYRFLRHSLLRRLEGGKCNVIAVSSTNDGVSMATAVKLAASLEEPGIFRVLLIDADLRRAGVTRHCSLYPVANDGLDTALANWSLRLSDCVRYLPQPYELSVLPTAARPDIAGRLLASPRFGVLILEARQQYDFVVVHTPPLLPTADCRAMAPWIDGFVVVVTAHHTRREVLEEALNGMREEQVLGLVFSEEQAPRATRAGDRVRE